MSTKHIDPEAAARIVELIKDLHIQAASKCIAKGDAAGADAVIDNWDGLLVKFGVK